MKKRKKRSAERSGKSAVRRALNELQVKASEARGRADAFAVHYSCYENTARHEELDAYARGLEEACQILSRTGLIAVAAALIGCMGAPFTTDAGDNHLSTADGGSIDAGGPSPPDISGAASAIDAGAASTPDGSRSVIDQAGDTSSPDMLGPLDAGGSSPPDTREVSDASEASALEMPEAAACAALSTWGSPPCVGAGQSHWAVPDHYAEAYSLPEASSGLCMGDLVTPTSCRCNYTCACIVAHASVCSGVPGATLVACDESLPEIQLNCR